MRRAAKVDDNQARIVEELRGVGASVQHLHQIGQGCPDILVGYRNVNYLIEIKDGAKPPSARELTDPERDWHAAWRGNVAVIKNVEEALNLIGCGFRFKERQNAD